LAQDSHANSTRLARLCDAPPPAGSSYLHAIGLSLRLIYDLPSISVVTPSFNQAQYLETAMRSVLDQGYAPLEYVVLDGGSKDGSAEIIKSFDARLTAWESAPDKGSYDAVSRGINMMKGEVIGWMNSDDAYLPGTLLKVGEIFARFPEIDWLTTLYPVLLDKRGLTVRVDHKPGFSREGFYAGENLPTPGAFSFGYVQQESTFWRRSLWERVGGQIDPEFRLAGDFSLWAQFFQHADLVGVAAPLAGFRVHPEQRIARTFETYNKECGSVLRKYGGHIGGLFDRSIREVARRMPFVVQPALAAAGAMRRARVVRWDLDAGDWKLEERFI
jgi:glycosyltransferase involved in cell wall biosynthesis